MATLEVAARPRFATMNQILIATIEVPGNSAVNLWTLEIVLLSNWNARPLAEGSRTIARGFLDAVSKLQLGVPKPARLRVPSVLSTSD